MGCWSIICGVVFVVTLMVGIITPFLVHSMLEKEIKKQIVVDSPKSPGYDSWVNNTTPNSPPIWLNFYLFNVTNPAEVIAGGIPTVVEVGPYSYREYNVYFDVNFLDGGNTRSVRKWQYYIYDPTHSFSGANPEKDRFTVVNAPFQAVLGNLVAGDVNGAWWETLAFDLLASSSQSSLFVSVTASELMWGYTDPLLSLVHSLKPDVNPVFSLQPNLTQQEAANIAPSVVQTGKDNIENIGNTLIWQGQNKLSCWATPDANTIGGNFDNSFPPFNHKEKVYLWIDQLFRKGTMEYKKEVEVLGIKMNSYGIPNSQLTNATLDPRAGAYYQYGPAGIANLTNPTGGAPIFISKPHFLDADPYYFRRVNMTPPDPEKHDTYLNIEPISGVMMQGAKRLQINVKFQTDALLYPIIRDDLYVPLAWIEETGGITQDLANQFKSAVYRAITISKVVQWTGIAVGIFCFIIAVVLFFMWRKSKIPEPRYHAIQ